MPPAAGFARRFAALGGLLGLLAAALVGLDAWGVMTKSGRDLELRLAAEARNRALALQIAAGELAGRANVVARSDVLRLVAGQLADGGAAAEGAWIRAQVPRVRVMLEDLVRSGGIAGVAILDARGRPLLAAGSPPPPPASEAWRQATAIGPVRVNEGPEAGTRGAQVVQPWLDAYVPLSAPSSSLLARPPAPRAVLAFTVPAAPVLDAILTPGPGNVRVGLAQPAGEGYARVQLEPEPALLTPLASQDVGQAAGDENLLRLLLDHEPRPLLASSPVAGTPFHVEASASAELVRHDVVERLQVTGPLALVLVLGLGWALAGRRARPAACEHDVSGRAEPAAPAPAVPSLQEGLEGLLEPVAVLGADGRLIAASRAARREMACEDPIGRPLEALGDGSTPRAWRELLDGPADREEACAVVASSDGSSRVLHLIRSVDQGCLLLTSHPAPRDLSQPSPQASREAGHEAVVAALIRAVELRDPFLLGHTQRLRQLAGEVGRRLRLDRTALASLDLAAALSQVGKAFVAEALLTKHERHDPDEERAMRAHIEHAISILEPLDFGLPVREMLLQMHERLDGSGYPNGLTGGQIGLPARILGTVDVFTARTSARVYRDAVRPGQALYHLARHPERYDGQVVAALAAVVAEAEHPPRRQQAADGSRDGSAAPAAA